MTDELLFAPEAEDVETSASSTPNRTIKVAIIDDDESIHQVTKVALSDFDFEGKKIEFVQGYSGEEARQILREHDDIAVILLDVVMEEDHAGLKVIKYIRDELKNKNTRIVLRTGQPGQAPEREVICKYDINDYKEKTELTARKLYTLMYSCLRAYRDIVALDESRRGLEKVINASKNIFEKQFLDEFALGVLQQLTSILHLEKDAFIGQIQGLAAHEEDDGIKIVAGTGVFDETVGQDVLNHLPDDMKQLMRLGDDHAELHNEDRYLAMATGQDGKKNIIYLTGIQHRSELDKHLVDLFCQNVLVAFDNLSLRDQITETQRELVYRLGEAVESRSKETGNHVKRVAEISKLLALKTGMPLAQAEVLKHASPMHDLGKIGIPDAILNKPGKLDADEWSTMQSHAMIGYEMLNGSKREILKLGGVLSLEHHEKWDGTGYPLGKAGEEITLESRITTIADVYDALASDRCYKKAWPLDKVYSFFKEQRGHHFDPQLVDLLFDNIEAVNRIRDRYQDKYTG